MLATLKNSKNCHKSQLKYFMEILFLGTGTSTGVPSLCCDCEVCLSKDPRNKRLRSSILVRHKDHTILVDTSPDLRQQCLFHGIKKIDTVLYTHHHADHVHGIDEQRSFNFFNKTALPIYGNAQTLHHLNINFSYIFGKAEQVGGGIPQLIPTQLEDKTYDFGDIPVTPLDIQHGKLIINGFRFKDCAYITDCSGIPDTTRDKLKGLKILILNALGFKPHSTHFNLKQALEAAKDINAKRTILTHINHHIDHKKVTLDLPKGVELALDGMRVNI